MIGLLVPSIVNPSFAALAREVDLAAKKRQLRVLIGNTYRQIEEEEAFLDDMFSHGVRGIIVAACDIEKAHFAQAAEQGMVMVNYDGRMPVRAQSGHFALDSVSMDNIEAGRMAAEHLIAQGCRRLAFATVEGMTPSRAHKIEGFLRAVQDHGLYREGMIVEGQAMAAYGRHRNDRTRAGAGVKNQPAAGVPGWYCRDQRCVGHWADGWSASGRDPCAGTDLYCGHRQYSALRTGFPWPDVHHAPLREMAEVMVERLIERTENPAIPPEEFLFPPSLVSRQSVQ